MSDIVPRLTTHTDQNYALRCAVREAAEKMVHEIYDWDKDKTARYYEELCAGSSHLMIDLKHPDDIDPL